MLRAFVLYICVCVYFGQCWQTSSISLYNARVTIYPLLKLSLMTEVTLLMIILLFFHGCSKFGSIDHCKLVLPHLISVALEKPA